MFKLDFKNIKEAMNFNWPPAYLERTSISCGDKNIAPHYANNIQTTEFHSKFVTLVDRKSHPAPRHMKPPLFTAQ